MTTDALSPPLVSTLGNDARRDLRVDLVRGLALLVIFSDHVLGNPLRDFMPISLGFSDMGEVFVFLSGYLNGFGHSPGRPATSFGSQLKKGVLRCLRIYGALLLAETLAIALGTNAFVLGRSADRSTLPRMLAENPWIVAWNFFTLQWIVWTYAVLALYLLLIGGVPFVAALLRWRLPFAMAASAAVYGAVQVWPQSVALPLPWGDAFYFNPFAWQFLFVLGMACGVGGGRYKAFIPRGVVPLIAALLGLEIAFLVKTGWFPEVDALPWFAESINKATLGPLRLAHFYGVLIVGRTLLASRDAHGRLPSGAGSGTVARPLIVCGQHPLATYCVGGLLVILGTWLLERFGAGWPWTTIVNIGGWTASVATAYAARGAGRWWGAAKSRYRSSGA